MRTWDTKAGGAKTWDVAVVGLGAMGSAVLYQLAKRGVRAIGIDRFAPPHDMGSSHGETRLTREAAGEGSAYVPLVRASHRIWRELEAETGDTLLITSGALVMASASAPNSHHGKPDFVRRSIAVAQENGIAHEIIDAAEIARRFPQFIGLRGDEIGYFEPGGGYVRPEACIAAQLSRAGAMGAEILTGTRVLGARADGSGVRIETDAGPIRAGRAVVATGPWISPFLGIAQKPIVQVNRQVLHWFGLERPELFGPRSPVFIWMHGPTDADYVYGFPPLAGQEIIKVATEQYDIASDPEALDRVVSPTEVTQMFERHLRGKLAGVSSTAVRSAVCMYTTTADRGFIIDAHPDIAGLSLISACSGHGFKHSAGIGEMAAKLLLEESEDRTSTPFSFARFALSHV